MTAITTTVCTYTDKKGWEEVAQLSAPPNLPITLPSTLDVHDFPKNPPLTLPSFLLVLPTDATYDERSRFHSLLDYLKGGGGRLPRSARIILLNSTLFLMPPPKLDSATSEIRCCYEKLPNGKTNAVPGRKQTSHNSTTSVSSPTKQLELPISSVHPGYFGIIAQSHAEWLFGAFAELIHNSYDAKAKSLNIDVEETASGPHLHVIDDGMLVGIAVR